MPKKSLPQWPADNVERVPLAEITGYERNPRTHSPEQIEKIAASMREFGWTMPVLLDEDGQLIAGHGRIEAARVLGYEDAPAVRAIGWTEDQKRAYVIADNRLTDLGGWDDVLLADELGALRLAGREDFAAIGFDADGVAELLGGGDPDPPPVPPSNYNEQYGVIVICADEGEQEAIYARLSGEGLNCRVVVT